MAMIKTKEEIEKIKIACKITDSIFNKIIKNFNFKTELELSNFIYKEIKKRKCHPSFDVIVASGSNASSPHHKPTNKKLEGFTVIDFGVIYKKYMSDMTRTIYIGNPTKDKIRLYNLLLQCQKIGIKCAVSPIKCKQIDFMSREYLKEYKKYFIHGLGHGVGTKIHEPPRLNKKSRYYLKENMIITIEPGIYIKNKLGIRIEDTCLIKKKECYPLTKSTKNFLIFNF